MSRGPSHEEYTLLSSALIAGSIAAHTTGGNPQQIAKHSVDLARCLATELGLKTEAQLDAEYKARSGG